MTPPRSAHGATDLADDRAPRRTHEGFPPSETATEPLRAAPARFGAAGISAGEEHLIKESLPELPTWSREPGPDRLADALGWFSIGLGALEFFNSRGLARWLGMDEKETLIRAYGVREIAQGVGLLTHATPRGDARWTHIRVVGDIIDIASLAPGLRQDNPNRRNVQLALASVVGVTVLDVMTSTLLAER
jgi:hypothetical protein